MAFLVTSGNVGKAEGTPAGGHADAIAFNGNKMTKKAPIAEAVIYRAVFGRSLAVDTISTFSNDLTVETEHPITAAQRVQLVALRPFVPVYYESSPSIFAVLNRGKPEECSVPSTDPDPDANNTISDAEG